LISKILKKNITKEKRFEKGINEKTEEEKYIEKNKLLSEEEINKILNEKYRIPKSILIKVDEIIIKLIKIYSKSLLMIYIFLIDIKILKEIEKSIEKRKFKKIKMINYMIIQKYVKMFKNIKRNFQNLLNSFEYMKSVNGEIIDQEESEEKIQTFERFKEYNENNLKSLNRFISNRFHKKNVSYKAALAESIILNENIFGDIIFENYIPDIMMERIKRKKEEIIKAIERNQFYIDENLLKINFINIEMEDYFTSPVIVDYLNKLYIKNIKNINFEKVESNKIVSKMKVMDYLKNFNFKNESFQNFYEDDLDYLRIISIDFNRIKLLNYILNTGKFIFFYLKRY
jgi:hypothetical protein